MKTRSKEEKEFLEYLLEEAQKKTPSPKDQAKEILDKLESNPEVFREFNTLLRKKKIKKINDGRKV